jgi:hypothetical protein
MTTKLPIRTDAPWCSECGMTLPNHWKGCLEGSNARTKEGTIASEPGAASTAPALAHPDSTGVDEMHDSAWPAPACERWI